jgi:hypothetical protein
MHLSSGGRREHAEEGLFIKKYSGSLCLCGEVVFELSGVNRVSYLIGKLRMAFDESFENPFLSIG